jgi:pimeloyl-ACP methyl ester carboxylesterase
MTNSPGVWTEEQVEVGGTKLLLHKAGTGDPLLVLHGEMGHSGWLRFHQALAQKYTLYLPRHPGFGGSDRLDWIMNVRDLAGWYLTALDDLGIAPVKVVGFSMGGWLAAEMATMHPDLFQKLVLVGALGVKPPSGEIFDMFLSVAKDYFTTSVLDPANTPEFQQLCPDDPSRDQVESWETAREEACRLGWRPYMYYPALPLLLQRLKRLSTLIVWGREDSIVPLSAGELYNSSIPGSSLLVLDKCGHQPQIEQADHFVELIQDFLAG